MNKQLELANRIIELNENKIKLESKLNYLKVEPKKGASGMPLMVEIKNGGNGGYCRLELKDDLNAVICVNNALLKYCNETIIEIEKELKSIQIKQINVNK